MSSTVYRFLEHELYDPLTPKGRARVEFLTEVFRRILEPYAEGWRGRDGVSVLDVCCGKGIGAAAIVQSLRGLGLEPRVTLVDNRREAVEFAESFLRSELGVEVTAFVMDAEEVYRIGERFDVITMTGFSSVHFDPWRMARLSAALAEALSDSGVAIVEEVDRLYRYLSKGVREVSIARIERGKVVLALHEQGDYDAVRGVVRIRMLDVVSGDWDEFEIHPWSVGGVAAMLWIFFSRVRIVFEGDIAYVIAEKPRRIVRPREIASSEPPLEE